MLIVFWEKVDYFYKTTTLDPECCWNNCAGLHKHQLCFVSWLKAVNIFQFVNSVIAEKQMNRLLFQLLVIKWIWTRCFIKLIIYSIFFYKDMSPESFIFAILLSATIWNLNLPWKTKGFGHFYFIFFPYETCSFQQNHMLIEFMAGWRSDVQFQA